MKVAISLPDPLFSEAESLANQLQVSRSQLYAKALAEFIERRRGTAVKAKLDQVYGASDSSLDRSLVGAQREVLIREAW